jgi:hypothetical protein
MAIKSTQESLVLYRLRDSYMNFENKEESGYNLEFHLQII